MSEFLPVFLFLIDVVGMIFEVFDTVILFEPYTFLDFFVAIEAVSITLWGVFEIISPNTGSGGSD